VGEERLLTGPEPGITRDAIAVEWRHRGRPIRLVDTAGMRRRSQVVERLEKLAVDDSLRAVQYAEVVVLVLDAADMLEAGPAIARLDRRGPVAGDRGQQVGRHRGQDGRSGSSKRVEISRAQAQGVGAGDAARRAPGRTSTS
jgi:GTP-binding protein